VLILEAEKEEASLLTLKLEGLLFTAYFSDGTTTTTLAVE
jgi:hypothetical protein